MINDASSKYVPPAHPARLWALFFLGVALLAGGALSRTTSLIALVGLMAYALGISLCIATLFAMLQAVDQRKRHERWRAMNIELFANIVRMGLFRNA